MKTGIIRIVVGLGFLTATLAHAQDTNIDWSAASDLQVELQAIEQVPPMPADDVTNGTAFWSAQHAPGSAEPWPPLPGNIFGMSAWDLGDGTYLLNDLGYRYHVHKRHKISSQNLSGSGEGMTMADDDGPVLPGDDDDDTNDYSPAGLIGLSPDYGTNLFIAQVSQGAGNYSGIISNTIVGGGFPYEIQYTYDLESTNGWQSANWLFYGSDVTNWTTFSVPMTSPTNMFFRVRSWQSEDDSGLPTWWEEEYFGTNNVNPYGDPMGDGWNNLEMFQNGMNPNLWYTPPAPQDLTSSINPNTGLVTVDWLASSGPVTSYTVNIDGNNFSVSAGSTSFQNNIADDDVYYNPYFFGPSSYYGTVEVRANYAGGNSSEASTRIQAMVDNPNNYSGYIAPGQQGQAFLIVPAFPSGTVAVQITRADKYAEGRGDYSFDTNSDIPVSAFTNSVTVLPASVSGVCPVDGYGESDYYWWIQTVDAQGNISGATLIDLGYADIGNANYNDYSGSSSEWPTEPWFDGREQLKQNLIFLLRAGLTGRQFSFTELYSGADVTFNYPTNYAYASYYEFGNNGDSATSYIGVLLPFGENYLYNNFIFNLASLNGSGALPSFTDYDSNLGIEEPPALVFDPPTVSGTTIAPVLGTNGWIYSSLPYDDYGSTPTIGMVENGTTNEMLSGYQNTFGLQFLSTEMAWGDSEADTLTLSPGDSTTQSGTLYAGAAEPQLETVGYDFWNTSGLTFNNTNLVPGMPEFSTTASSQLLIAGVGQQDFRVAGYTKEELLNGYSGVYGYLGQYFTNAYQIDGNGNVTTNQTGILSPYGDFFPTQPGSAALVTMPDPDTGAQGTCTVYCVSLALDANHDGNMDLNFGGTDATSPSSPYVFWCNNNFDRWDYDSLSATNEQDDIETNGVDDCNFANYFGQRVIPTTRDLEDFSRLWICGVTSNLLAALPTNSTVTLSWGDVGNPNPNNPTIDLFEAADADGGIGYLTNETVATAQIQNTSIGRLGPGQSIQLNANYFGSNWRGNYFIWCGVSNGVGGLNLTIADGSGNVLAQSTAYIQIEDIKNMYERWTVGDSQYQDPLSVATNAADNLPGPTYQPFQYPAPQDTNTPYILFVHGYNMQTWEKDRYAETAFKRLYWQGYQGRFGEFRWPTADNALQFDSSEYRAWQSGLGLSDLLTKLNAEYPRNVYALAHSMGNIVTGEALRESGTNIVVNTYVAAQGAVPSHCYDPTTPTMSLYNDSGTPDRHAYYPTNGGACYFNGIGGAGTFINFYNTNDWALTFAWPIDQNAKPASGALLGYSFSSPDSYYENFGFAEIYLSSETYLIYAQIIQGRCNELGAQAGVAGPFSTAIQVNLAQQPYNFGDTHVYHSAEFRSDNEQRWQFWNQVLVRMKLKSQ